ncbi:hypothetical protein ABH961_004524 [Bacillus sp. RC251]
MMLTAYTIYQILSLPSFLQIKLLSSILTGMLGPKFLTKE